MAWHMTPAEVLDRFTSEEMIRVLAYQNLYGPVGPRRLDVLAARLGMDVAAPHMKKGRLPKLKDHLIQWSRPRKTGRELLEMVKGLQAGFEAKGGQR
ncbi:phage tail assembly protein T [Streptomyces sp. CA-146814]|uniref:phage tail assembly protein T n=1 Tax=Streptomyces sp. CA-146814 TaxID=3240053 RepID=UPI003D913472